MSLNLVILTVAAFAIVAILVSCLVDAALPWLDRLAALIPARRRARLWLSIAALPSAVGFLAVGGAFLPALGIGHDHCLAHGPHHPHLCPHHLGGAPGIVLICIALLLGVRFVQLLFVLGRELRISRNTSEALAQASDKYDDVFVFPADKPQAFVLGAVHTRVHISQGLLALGRDILEPVLAHERVHAKQHDLLWRALCPVLSLGHLPTTTDALRSRLATAQELAADAEAAEALIDGQLKIAGALVRLARLTRTPSPGLSFTHGDLKNRVQALLEGQRALPTWPAPSLMLAACTLSVVLTASHNLIHHALETLLGALS